MLQQSLMRWILPLAVLWSNRTPCGEAFDKLSQPRFLKRTREVVSSFVDQDVATRGDDENNRVDPFETGDRKFVQKIWRFSRQRSIMVVGGVRAISSLRAGSSPQQLGAIDGMARSFTIFLGWIVSLQAIGTAMHSNRDRLFELASRLMSHETISAAKTIKEILASVDDHGVIDVFSKYPTQDLFASVFALSRLQAACRQYDRYNEANNESDNRSGGYFPDESILEDLRHYASFAAAAYGWKMDLATAGRLHRGDRQALVKMTGIDLEDIVTVNWDSGTNRPRKRIVLSIRGTWSAHDVLTDLCCTSEEFFVGRSRHKAHNGMLAAARGVSSMAEEVVAIELEENPGYSLLLVGHSLGGSVAAVLGTLWEQKFAGTTVYAYGPACVSPENNKGGCRIISVLVEGDPFSCLSLGHVADVSCALAHLCENTELRSTILMRTDGPSESLEERDLIWCSEAMKDLQLQMVGEKLYPPGRLLFISKPTKKMNSNTSIIREVSTDFFRELRVGPRMFDLSRHIPRLYEARLRQSRTFAQI